MHVFVWKQLIPHKTWAVCGILYELAVHSYVICDICHIFTYCWFWRYIYCLLVLYRMLPHLSYFLHFFLTYFLPYLSFPLFPGQMGLNLALFFCVYFVLCISFDWWMRAFVVLGLVFSYEAKRLARGNVSEMTYFVSSGTWNHSSVSYVLAVVSRTSQVTAAETFPVQPPHRRQFARIVESRTSFRCGPCVFAVCLVQFVFVPVRCAGTTI